MTTTIEVNKQSVKQLLEGGKDHPFVIPEYQRPYEWESDQIQTLFDDLWNFTTDENEGPEGTGTYFLGSIVSYQNEQGEQEIIDGQQRITSLFLLLRAIYTSISNCEKTCKEADNFIKQIEPTLWKTNIMTGEVDYSRILLFSRVMNNEGNEILRDILMTGKTDPERKDNYSKNYRQFQELFAKVSQSDPMRIYQFIYVILHKAILLPISADTQDTALTIFSTLNDRGLPLSDADIFKAKIYNKLDKEAKKEFVNKWKDLDGSATDAGESVQQLFYYYMFYLRALEKDDRTTTPGIRKYYSKNNSARLFQPELLENLQTIQGLWSVINTGAKLEDESWSTDPKVLQALDILSAYPNEFWKYPVVNYYLTYRDKDNYAEIFLKFLHKLIRELLTKYLVIPTVSAVKADILKLNVEVTVTEKPKFAFKPVDMKALDQLIRNPHKKTVRMLLKILAYEKQDTLLPSKWEIEHIFPRKWQTNYFPKENEEMVIEKVEHIGNKIPFEKKLNIVAGNGYFTKKQKEYEQSEIIITKEMADPAIQEWTMDSIAERDVRISDEIKNILDQWENEYHDSQNKTPTSEELEMIKKFKQNGWV